MENPNWSGQAIGERGEGNPAGAGEFPGGDATNPVEGAGDPNFMYAGQSGQNGGAAGESY